MEARAYLVHSGSQVFVASRNGEGLAALLGCPRSATASTASSPVGVILACYLECTTRGSEHAEQLCAVVPRQLGRASPRPAAWAYLPYCRGPHSCEVVFCLCAL